MASKQEDFQNRTLALLLTEQGVAADFEQREGRRRMDMVAEAEGLRSSLRRKPGSTARLRPSKTPTLGCASG